MTNEERAREAAEKVLIDFSESLVFGKVWVREICSLSDQSGMNLLDQIRWDEPELWGEIVGDGSSIILAALDAATAPLVAAKERLLKRVERAEKLLAECISKINAVFTGDTPNV